MYEGVDRNSNKSKRIQKRMIKILSRHNNKQKQYDKIFLINLSLIVYSNITPEFRILSPIPSINASVTHLYFIQIKHESFYKN